VVALEQTLSALRSEVAAAAENYKTLENQYLAGTATSLDAQKRAARPELGADDLGGAHL